MFITENTISSINPVYAPEPDWRYSGVTGCEQMCLENVENAYTLFKIQCQVDAREIGMVNEGASEFDIQYFIEGALGDIWNKLKEWVKKIWAKLKAIITGYIARLEAFMGKNGYAFYEKYKKTIWNGVHLKDVKTKYKKVLHDEIPLNDENPILWGLTRKLYQIDNGEVKNNDVDQDDINDAMIDKLTKGTFKDYKDLKKDVQEYVFDTEETEELEDGKINEYIKYIMDKKSITEQFEKTKNGIDKTLNHVIKEIEKLHDEVTKKMTNEKDPSDTKQYDGLSHQKVGIGKFETKDNKTTLQTYDLSRSWSQQEISKYQHVAQSYSSAWGKYAGIWIECCKEMVSQSRRIAAIIVAYRSRHKNEAGYDFEESDIFYQVIGEAAEWETMDALDDHNQVA